MRTTIFTGASRIQLRDGTELKENNPRVLKSIVHQQLHTHLNKFELRKGKKKVDRRPKAKRPVNFKKEMESQPHFIKYHH